MRCNKGFRGLADEIIGKVRDSMSNARPAFVVDDVRYVSARWPGDTHTFAATVSVELPD